MISENSMMSIPENEIDVVKIPKDIPDLEVEDYDLMDDKDREKYIKDLERHVRSSYEYRQMGRFEQITGFFYLAHTDQPLSL